MDEIIFKPHKRSFWLHFLESFFVLILISPIMLFLIYFGFFEQYYKPFSFLIFSLVYILIAMVLSFLIGYFMLRVRKYKMTDEGIMVQGLSLAPFRTFIPYKNIKSVDIRSKFMISSVFGLASVVVSGVPTTVKRIGLGALWVLMGSLAWMVQTKLSHSLSGLSIRDAEHFKHILMEKINES